MYSNWLNCNYPLFTVTLGAKPAALKLYNLGHVECSISNAVGWRSISVLRSLTNNNNITLFQINNTTPATPSFMQPDITVTENTLSSRSGHVTLKFKTTCYGANLVDYICMVQVGDFKWREHQQVHIQRKCYSLLWFTYNWHRIIQRRWFIENKVHCKTTMTCCSNTQGQGTGQLFSYHVYWTN